MTVFLVYRFNVVESIWLTAQEAIEHARDTDSIVERVVYGKTNRKSGPSLFELRDAIYNIKEEKKEREELRKAIKGEDK